MPHPDMPGMKQKGRVYVCDLAGTEPAGDIVYALYEKKVSGRLITKPGRDPTLLGGSKAGATCFFRLKTLVGALGSCVAPCSSTPEFNFFFRGSTWCTRRLSAMLTYDKPLRRSSQKAGNDDTGTSWRLVSDPALAIRPPCDVIPNAITPETFECGDIEYKFLGPHQDQRKTKELQDQGKKINLSLSEVGIAV